MLYCSNCGKELEGGVKFCPNCGQPQKRQASSESLPGSRNPTEPTRVRHAGMRILSLVDFAVGIIVIGFGALVLFASLTSFALSLGIIVVILGVLSVAVGYGLRNAKSWAWLLGLWAGIVYIILGLIVFLGPYLAGIGCIVFGAAQVYYLNKADAKEYLGKVKR